MATRRRWFGLVVLCAVTASGCATGNMADPDAAVLIDEDVDEKLSPEDTGKKPVDTGEGEDAVVDEDVGEPTDTGETTDTGEVDAGTMDAGMPDTGPRDTGALDTGALDTGPRDTGPMDTGPRDTGPVDAGPVDTGPRDTGPVDTGTGPTITCPLPIGSTTCTGSRACCFSFFGLPAGCGCSTAGGLICLPCS
jgi:hypothetical protein